MTVVEHKADNAINWIDSLIGGDFKKGQRDDGRCEGWLLLPGRWCQDLRFLRFFPIRVLVLTLLPRLASEVRMVSFMRGGSTAKFH